MQTDFMPTGAIVPFSGAVIPPNWLECNGQAIGRTAYPGLFAIIGQTYGNGDGSTTFNLPDLRGKCPVGFGQGSGLTSRLLGQSGGEETHVLSLSEIASHTHGLASHTHATSHTNSVFEVDSAGSSTGLLAGSSTTTAGSSGTQSSPASPFNTGVPSTNSTSSMGGGAAHNNMAPFICVRLIIKV